MRSREGAARRARSWLTFGRDQPDFRHKKAKPKTWAALELAEVGQNRRRAAGYHLEDTATCGYGDLLQLRSHQLRKLCPCEHLRSTRAALCLKQSDDAQRMTQEFRTILSGRVVRPVETRLALHGGRPAITQRLPPMFPGGMRMDAAEERAVLSTLRSKRLFRYYGPYPGDSKVEAFETAFAARMKAAHGTAVNSGTAALICGLAALGVGPGDEVIVPCYTWIASAEAVVAVGAVPVLAEIDDSLSLDVADAENKITGRTKAIMPVHMRGAPCQMADVMALARRHGLKVIEDVAQATGGGFCGQPLGGVGDVGAFSFQWNKIITCGEGGIAITKDVKLHQRIVMQHDVVGGVRNNVPDHELLNGCSFRMSELHGAIMLVQLEKLDSLLTDMRRRKLSLKCAVDDVARSRGVVWRKLHDPDGDTAIALVFFAPTAQLAARAARALNAEGVGASVLYEPQKVDYHVYPHWTPILNKRVWSEKGGPWRWNEGAVAYDRGMCSRSLELLARAVHLDISPDLSDLNVEELNDALTKVMRAVL